MKSLLILLFFVFLPVLGFSAQEKLILNIDGSFFYHDGDNIRWELYYSMPDNSITYLPNASPSYTGEAILKVSILSSGIEVAGDKWVITNRIDSLEQINRLMLFGIKSFILPPGQYQISVYARDYHDTSNHAETKFDVLIPKIDKNDIGLSGIMMSSYITNADSTNIKYDDMFLRFDKYIFPNPSLELAGDKPLFLGYIEIYNALKYSQSGFIKKYKIYDGANRLVYTAQTTVKPDDDFMNDIIYLPVDSLFTGVYFFEYAVVYPFDNPIDSISVSKKFYVLNLKMPPLTTRFYTENELFEKSIFAAMTPQNTDIALRMARIIATPLEIDQIKLLTATEAKQRFLFKFWLQQDPDTSTYLNEKYADFMRCVDYSNHFFSWRKEGEGWNSERGRIVLRYGIPTERKQYDANAGYRAYEEWFYENVQGGTYFYFVDKSNVGNFQLVHSTARNEPFDPDWYKNHVPSTNDLRFQEENNYMNDNDSRRNR